MYVIIESTYSNCGENVTFSDVKIVSTKQDIIDYVIEQSSNNSVYIPIIQNWNENQSLILGKTYNGRLENKKKKPHKLSQYNEDLEFKIYKGEL